uniref:Uncharacterized protein n=1 Tax=Timema monikensis TaxID=170555 RepID=A0A7R9HJH6_9NEOP|nr:unnamed protein product [Timema monikensis]
MTQYVPGGELLSRSLIEDVAGGPRCRMTQYVQLEVPLREGDDDDDECGGAWRAELEECSSHCYDERFERSPASTPTVEPYRPSGGRLLAKIVADRGYHVVSATNSPAINLVFLDRSNRRLLSAGTNIALMKPANQSTTVRGGAAANGNDGERTPVHDGKSCTETMKEASPWWMVEPGGWWTSLSPTLSAWSGSLPGAVVVSPHNFTQLLELSDGRDWLLSTLISYLFHRRLMGTVPKVLK